MPWILAIIAQEPQVYNYACTHYYFLPHEEMFVIRIIMFSCPMLLQNLFDSV